MPVVLYRVDDRLVHGQIIEGWVPFVGAQVILVANDAVSGDNPRCRLMRMMTPGRLDLGVVAVSELSKAIESLAGSRIMVLFADLTDVAEAAANGLRMECVNLGNLHHLRGGREVAPSVYLNRGDVEIALDLMTMGIRLEVQETPEGRYCDLLDVLDREPER